MKRRLVFLFCLSAILAYLWQDAASWVRAARTVELGVRELGSLNVTDRPGAIYLDHDALYWLSYAQRIKAGESWRIRHTQADNTPAGRSVHWSQSVSWLLVLFGQGRQICTGEESHGAVELASVWVNPTLFTLLVVGLALALVRRVGPVPTVIFLATLVSLGDVGWAFQPLRPGHQTFHVGLGLVMLIGVVLGGAGWVSRLSPPAAPNLWCSALETPTSADARRWFLISAVAAACSLWVSAVVSTMLLSMLFCGLVFTILVGPRESNASEMVVEPLLWRRWGVVAGLGSFLFYLLEYAPNHLHLLRLEINGPVYSVAIMAMGECLARFLALREDSSPARGRDLVVGVSCGLVAASVPIAIVLGPPSLHALRDPEMLRLHNFIQEFYSLPRFAGERVWKVLWENFGVLPLFFGLAMGLARFAKLRPQEWAGLWLSFVLALGSFCLSYLQIRWFGLFAAMNAWLALVASVCTWRIFSPSLGGAMRKIVATLLGVGLLVQPVLMAANRNRQVQDVVNRVSLPYELANPVLNKRYARAFLKEVGVGQRVMSDPDLTPSLQYFAAAEGVSSFYWENIPGLHTATRFFADSGSDEARKTATDHRISYVVVPEGNRLPNYFYTIATGRIDESAASRTFAARLAGNESSLPSWLETNPALQRIGNQVYTYGGSTMEDRRRTYRVVPLP